MAYEKHTWSCGETVTADLLNHMEDGIAEGGGSSGGVMRVVIDEIVEDDDSSFTLNGTTARDVIDAVIQNSTPLLVQINGEDKFSGEQYTTMYRVSATSFHVFMIDMIAKTIESVVFHYNAQYGTYSRIQLRIV